jgi:hypothetical protein
MDSLKPSSLLETGQFILVEGGKTESELESEIRKSLAPGPRSVARSVQGLKNNYEENPQLILDHLSVCYGNLSRMLSTAFPDGTPDCEIKRERLIYCILEILGRPQNQQLKTRFEQMCEACQSALWLKGKFQYFNMVSEYKLPPDANPSAMMALGKFWMQNTIVKQEATPEISPEVKQAKRINQELEDAGDKEDDI